MPRYIIPKAEKWKYINLNPTAPTIKYLVKIHKQDSPLRPIVNWKKAKAYQISQDTGKKLQTYIPLQYIFNYHYHYILPFIMSDRERLISSLSLTRSNTTLINISCSQLISPSNLLPPLIHYQY
jgi:hypothetical protein